MEKEVEGQLMEKAVIKLTQGTLLKNEKRVIRKKASTWDVRSVQYFS